MRWLHFILSHSVFISLCAVALCFQTTILLKLPFDYMLGGMVFFSTMAGYNLYWALSKYTFSRHLSLKEILAHNCSHLILAFSGGLFLLYYLYRQPSTLHFMLVAFLLTTAYSLPLWPLKFAQKFRKTGFFKNNNFIIHLGLCYGNNSGNTGFKKPFGPCIGTFGSPFLFYAYPLPHF